MNRKAFFDDYRVAFGHISPGEVVGLDMLLRFIEEDTMPDIRWTAYFLATAKHECANTWLPIEERGKVAYFDRYGFNTKIGRSLGTTQPGDGYLFRGRGYVQLTGRTNYLRMGRLLGIDLVGNPDLARVPLTAYQIACVGMAKGLFTGLGLGDFIRDDKCDYRNARRVINGTDRADLIAGYAHHIEVALRSSVMSEEGAPAPTPSPDLPPHINILDLARAARQALETLVAAMESPK